MKLEELFKKRQSTREFSDTEIPDAVLERICALSVLAPSAVNAQPYRLFAVNGKKAKEFSKNVQKDGANRWADGAKAFIVIKAEKPISITRGARTITNAPFIENDAGILAAYVTLAAESEGVQSCIIGLRDEKGIAEFLNLGPDAHFPLVVALGYAAENYPVRKKDRRSLNETYKLIK